MTYGNPVFDIKVFGDHLLERSELATLLRTVAELVETGEDEAAGVVDTCTGGHLPAGGLWNLQQYERADR